MEIVLSIIKIELEFYARAAGLQIQHLVVHAWVRIIAHSKVVILTNYLLLVRNSPYLNVTTYICLELFFFLFSIHSHSPLQVKEIVETFSSSADDFNDISKVLDFHIGLPYGFILSVWGFGVILGGALLALSVSSLKSYKRGESSPLATKGQAGCYIFLSLQIFKSLK